MSGWALWRRSRSALTPTPGSDWSVVSRIRRRQKWFPSRRRHVRPIGGLFEASTRGTDLLPHVFSSFSGLRNSTARAVNIIRMLFETGSLALLHCIQEVHVVVVVAAAAAAAAAAAVRAWLEKKCCRQDVSKTHGNHLSVGWLQTPVVPHFIELPWFAYTRSPGRKQFPRGKLHASGLQWDVLGGDLRGKSRLWDTRLRTRVPVFVPLEGAKCTSLELSWWLPLHKSRWWQPSAGQPKAVHSLFWMLFKNICLSNLLKNLQKKKSDCS